MQTVIDTCSLAPTGSDGSLAADHSQLRSSVVNDSRVGTEIERGGIDEVRPSRVAQRVELVEGRVRGFSAVREPFMPSPRRPLSLRSR
jgi:hypothetical protein